jgi:hypothetical protein
MSFDPQKFFIGLMDYRISTSCRFSMPNILLSSAPGRRPRSRGTQCFLGRLGVQEFPESGAPEFTELGVLQKYTNKEEVPMN